MNVIRFVVVVGFIIVVTDILFIFRCRYTGALVLPLYASMSRAQQMAVFQVGLKIITITITAIISTRTANATTFDESSQLSDALNTASSC